MTEKSPLRALILYAIMFAALFAATVKFLHLPQTTLGTMGRIAAFGAANYIAFLWLIGRHKVIRHGAFGYEGPWIEGIILAPAFTLAVTLLFPLGVLVLRFGDPAVFTVIGMAVLGLLSGLLVVMGCGGEDWSEAAARFDAERAAEKAGGPSPQPDKNDRD